MIYEAVYGQPWPPSPTCSLPQTFLSVPLTFHGILASEHSSLQYFLPRRPFLDSPSCGCHLLIILVLVPPQRRLSMWKNPMFATAQPTLWPLRERAGAVQGTWAQSCLYHESAMQPGVSPLSSLRPRVTPRKTDGSARWVLSIWILKNSNISRK